MEPKSTGNGSGGHRRANLSQRRAHVPSTERGRQSRQRLLDAAEEVFGETHYHRASIADITREAGVAHATFHVNCDTTQDIFLEVLEWLRHLIRVTTNAATEGAGRVIEAEELRLGAFFALVREHPYLYRIAHQADVVDEVVDKYSKRLANAMERGQIRRTDPETVVYCLLGIADFLRMRWPYWTGKPIPPEVFAAVMSFIRTGIEPTATQSQPGE